MICTTCQQEMLSATVCVARPLNFKDGLQMQAVPFSFWTGERCHDCNVVAGSNHNPGCDMEICPRCRGQIISCGCQITA